MREHGALLSSEVQLKDSFFGRVIIALVPVMWAASSTAATETIRTKVLKENIAVFQSDCKAGGVPAADCWCIVKTLNSTRDGAFILDMMGLRIRKLERNKAEVLAAVNRHGLKRSEALAILPRAVELAKKASDSCD